jgi:hypothetical protein
MMADAATIGKPAGPCSSRSVPGLVAFVALPAEVDFGFVGHVCDVDRCGEEGGQGS